MSKTKEEQRLEEELETYNPWRKWGAYVADRAWGTVREDYSPDGEAWDYFPFEKAHEKIFRWGEDGIGAFCDYYQLVLFSPAFWNGKDPILKERYYGLTTWQGNHGEDCKEHYYYLDALPTHSYLKCLYKYPQQEYPYADLKEENKKRGPQDREYELLDTGIFDENKYFDVFIEYAKNEPEDIAIAIEVHNRADEPAGFHLLGQLILRNRWAMFPEKMAIPEIEKIEHDKASALFIDLHDGPDVLFLSQDYSMPRMFFYGEKEHELLFTDNESKGKKQFSKDAFGRLLVHKEDNLRKDVKGTKAAMHSHVTIEPKGKRKFLFRLCRRDLEDPLKDVEEIIQRRKKEADQFYDHMLNKNLSKEEKMIQRQAFAGLIWTQQFYFYRVNAWLSGDNVSNPPPSQRLEGRNTHWRHLFSKMVLLVCDKWEYPWFASWDLSFHCIAIAMIDPTFAKQQIEFLYSDRFQHPNGQVPAYEWEFSDLNPPVLPLAAWRIYKSEQHRHGRADRDFLERVFERTLLEFSWWVNKVDKGGRNVFEGGFLGLDNITIVDRSTPLKEGIIEQSDGTGWMGMFCILLMRMALELANEDHNFEILATKFFEHFFYIKEALQSRKSEESLWNSEDGFFYDLMCMPDGKKVPLKIRSIVGIVPILGVGYLDHEMLDGYINFKRQFFWFLETRGKVAEKFVTRLEVKGKTRYLFSLVTLDQLRLILERILDEEEFLSPYGIRSISKYYEKHPFTLDGSTISYEPGESLARIKGGNSNWRGPIWFPMNYLIIEALKVYHHALGENFKVNFQGKQVCLGEVAKELSGRLSKLFKTTEDGKRPIFGDYEKMQQDPYFKDHLFFYEHYHGDNGRGLGATHQTGWSALIASLIDEWLADG